jgi:hypothetical protein
MRVVWFMWFVQKGCVPAGCRHVRASQVLDGDPPGIIPSCRESPCSPSDVYWTSTSCGPLTGPGRLSTEVLPRPWRGSSGWSLPTPIWPVQQAVQEMLERRGRVAISGPEATAGPLPVGASSPLESGVLGGACGETFPHRTRSKRHGQDNTFVLEDLGCHLEMMGWSPGIRQTASSRPEDR